MDGIPVLIQLARNGGVSHLARATGNGLRGELREYPVDHVDVYVGVWQERALTDQLDFLRRCL